MEKEQNECSRIIANKGNIMNALDVPGKSSAKGPSWALRTVTPLLISLFVVSGVTGLMMFFHIKSVSELHIWGSIVFVVIAGIHSKRNWNPILAHFRSWPAWAGVASAIVIVLLFALLAPDEDSHRRHGPRGGAPHFDLHE